MAKRMTDLGYWFHGALLCEAGLPKREAKGKLARMGWAQMRTFGRESDAYAGREAEPTSAYVQQDQDEKPSLRKDPLNPLRATLLYVLAQQLELNPDKYMAQVIRDMRDMARGME